MNETLPTPFSSDDKDYFETYGFYGYLAVIHPILVFITNFDLVPFSDFLVSNFGVLLSRVICWVIVLIEPEGFFIAHCIHAGFAKTNPLLFTFYLFIALVKRLYFNYKQYLINKLAYQNGYINGARESINLIHVNDFQLLDFSQNQLMERYNNVQLGYIKTKVKDFMDTMAQIAPTKTEDKEDNFIIRHEKCCICFSDKSEIITNPCRHLAMCQECFESYINDKYEQNKPLKCVLCSCPISSIDCANKKSFIQNPVPSNMFHVKGQVNAHRELMKLANYLRANPHHRATLKDPDIFNQDY